MPASIVKSFAERTDKSTKEVESLWDDAKKMLKIDEASAPGRYTVYKVQPLKAFAKDGLEAKFLEYLNDDELDKWMLGNAKKYPMIVAVRSDGAWVLYDQPKGNSFKKFTSGKNFNSDWRGKYNKKADVDSVHEGLLSFSEFKESLNEDVSKDFEEAVKEAKGLALDNKSASELMKDKSYVKGKINGVWYTFFYTAPEKNNPVPNSLQSYKFMQLVINDDKGKVINKHDTTFLKIAKSKNREKALKDNLKEFKAAVQEVKGLLDKKH
jgi:hypothetical protein